MDFIDITGSEKLRKHGRSTCGRQRNIRNSLTILNDFSLKIFCDFIPMMNHVDALYWAF